MLVDNRSPLTHVVGLKFFFSSWNCKTIFFNGCPNLELRSFPDFQIISASSVVLAQVVLFREGMSSPVHYRPHYSLLTDSGSVPGLPPHLCRHLRLQPAFRAVTSRILRYSPPKNSRYLGYTAYTYMILSCMGHLPLWFMAKEFGRCYQGP